MKKVAFILIAVFLVGCASLTPSKMQGSILNRIDVGMTKAEVMQIMGEPSSTKADGNAVILEYMLYDRDGSTLTGLSYMTYPFWVILVNGKVTKYGKAGDFGTAGPSHTEKLILSHE